MHLMVVQSIAKQCAISVITYIFIRPCVNNKLIITSTRVVCRRVSICSYNTNNTYAQTYKRTYKVCSCMNTYVYTIASISIFRQGDGLVRKDLVNKYKRPSFRDVLTYIDMCVYSEGMIFCVS